MTSVKKIIQDVKNNGDSSILKYNILFDKNYNKIFKINKKQIKRAYNKVDRKTLNAIKSAIKNIKFFAKAQLKEFKDINLKRDFGIIGQKIVPLLRVGCYVPGGNFSLPSSALMSIIPAKIAGVKEIIICSPKISSVTIVAADLAGATKIFNIGGVQAIAALAYGTNQIPPVDKIVGPGNKYVTDAKKLVFGDVGIDFIAGPSEVMIIADKYANPRFIAADLLAQAEHDINSKANLLTTSKKIAREVNFQIDLQLEKLKTKFIAKKSMNNGKIILVKNLNEAIRISNEYSPEHLEIQVKNPKKIISRLKNYGSLFIGKYSAEVFGDYCSGTNHTLPTNRAARYTGGLSVKEFIKILTYQKINKNKSMGLIKIAMQLAEIEGLDAHKKAAEIRLKETLINKPSFLERKNLWEERTKLDKSKEEAQNDN